MDCRRLLAWLEAPSPYRGIHFARADDDWDFWTYAGMAQVTRQVAWGLIRAGVRKNDVVALVQRSGPEFVSTFFATLLVGATPSPLAPAVAFQNTVMYEEHIAGALLSARPALVVTHADLLFGIAKLAANAGVPDARTVDDLRGGPEDERLLPDRGLAQFALLQFTSGSSGRGRAVRVPFRALESNVESIRRWLHWTDDSAFASWLPLYHDMGLIGGLISSVIAGSDLWLLQPEQFIRRPLRYLRCFGAQGANLTVTASFGLEHILRRVRPEDLENLDFSEWHGMVVGAERIDARSLYELHGLLSPFGFRRGALLPAYGMAEATLAITGLPLGQEWAAVTVESSSLSIGREVIACEKGTAAAQVVVGCGRPLEGISVAVVDEEERPLSDGWVGEITVRGPSVVNPYLQNMDFCTSRTRFTADTMYTGDIGFVIAGQVFVLGRLGDSMKVRGQLVFAEDLETSLVPMGVPPHQVAALLGQHEGVPTAVVVFERFNNRWREQVEAMLRNRIGGARIVLVNAPKGTIVRTSSGKPKRRQLWRAFVEGVLPGQVVINSKVASTEFGDR